MAIKPENMDKARDVAACRGADLSELDKPGLYDGTKAVELSNRLRKIGLKERDRLMALDRRRDDDRRWTIAIRILMRQCMVRNRRVFAHFSKKRCKPADTFLSRMARLAQTEVDMPREFKDEELSGAFLNYLILVALAAIMMI